jgi:hypothetical protein
VAQSPETLDALFVNLVMIFKTAAFQQLGKTLNPMTGKVEKNLEQARFSIDMIEMLKEKTRGNLSGDLDKLMDSTLLELRMNYVEEANAGAAEADDKADAEDSGADAGPEPAPGSGAAENDASEPDKAGSDTGPGEPAGDPRPDTRESAGEQPGEAGSEGAGPGDEKKGQQGD